MPKKNELKTNSRGGNHNGGVKSRQEHYNTIATHFPKAIDTLVDILNNSKQDSVRISAANKIIDKVLPNLQAQDITTGGDKIQLNVVYLPTKRPLEAPSQTDGSIGEK